MTTAGDFGERCNRRRMPQRNLFGFDRIRAQHHSSEQPKVTINDVAGADDERAELQEEVDFLSHPKRYHDMEREFPETVGSDELQRILGPRLDSEVEQIARVVAGPRK